MCLLSQLSWDRALTAASLALGFRPRSHFTHHREADTSGLGSVVRHNSWTAAAVRLFPFQKNNKNESSSGVRQALQALEENREAVLKQRLKGLLQRQTGPSFCPCVPLCLECPHLSSLHFPNSLCDFGQITSSFWALDSSLLN